MDIVLEGRVPSKKNSKRIFRAGGKVVIAPSSDHEKWHAVQKWEVASQKVRTYSKCFVRIVFTFGSRQKCDLTNKAESIMDLLVDCGVIPDDNFFVVPMVTLIGKYEKDVWKTEIEFFEAV